MVSVEFIPATRKHLTSLWMNMAPDDYQECHDFGVRPREGLLTSWRRSAWSNVIMIDGEPAAIWGVGGVLLSDEGHPWTLTTPLVRRAPKACIQIARGAMAEALTHYPRLVNYVSVAHVRALRTMELIGFSIGPTQPLGRHNKLFCRIEMVRDGH